MNRASLAAIVALLPLATLLGLRPPPPSEGGAREQGPPRPQYGQPAKVKPIPGMSAALWAKEPLVQDPVAFCIDEHGRIFVAESERQERGIEDNRSSAFWLMDDIQSETVEDRLRMFEKWAGKRQGGMDYYRRYADRVTRVEDTDGNGVADKISEFAGPFNEPLDGTGAGLVARDGDIWYTNIPNLWRLRDTNDDGKADQKDAVWHGFGVRVALRGHDMHGLTWGPDGKLYWSIGDRGYHITLPDGRVLADPRSGAVFRCRPDGTGLELFYTGLRNPQELAFDDYGNLFTGDNNSDAGDKARIVYCAEGGQTGWSMDYQSMEGSNVRGPWNQEEIWAMRPDLAPDRTTQYSKVQPAWTLPPLSHVGSGPSGLAHYPGLGLADRYKGHFFLCDFLGGDSYSRVLAFGLEPHGAGFRVVDVHPFVENVLPTDVDFGYDGKVYITDWGGGWESKNAGEIYAVWDPTRVGDPRIREVAQLMREGFAHRSADELRQLLGHADQRIRLRAQFALADRGPESVALLADVAANEQIQLARVHAIWALGQIAGDGLWPDAVESLVRRLDDRDPEIRAQAAKVLGEARFIGAVPGLGRSLSDESARVRYFAAMALGRMRVREAVPQIIALLAENDGKDVFLRHAGVMALAWIGERESVQRLANEPQAELRLSAALVMRRWADPGIARFLQDQDERIVVEAARAINDLPIRDAMPRLIERGKMFLVEPSAATVAKAAFTRDVWRNVADAGGSNLDTDPRFGTHATEEETVTVFEGKPKDGDRYLQRISGVITAPATGPYSFFIASDDHSVLYLSPTEYPSQKVKIAWVEGYSSRGDWSGQPNQVSQPVMLEAGKRYYVEARHAEGGGDDHLAVGWQLPDDSLERPIGGGTSDPLATPLLRRIINACVRSDDPGAASLLGDLARSAAVPEPMRVEALAGLADWSKPGPRDRVMGAYRPVDPGKKDAEAWKAVLKQKLPSLVARGSPAIRTAARDLANAASIPLDGGASFDIVVDAKQPVEERIACLRQLCLDGDSRASQAIEQSLGSDQALLRAEARRQLATRDPERGAEVLTAALSAQDRRERQAAIAALAGLASPKADAALDALVAELRQGGLDPNLRLDVLRAAERRAGTSMARDATAWLQSVEAKGSLVRFDLALEGGDAARGFDVVHYHLSATCLKCHTIAGTGGDAAPKLDGVGTRLTRERILESLVSPNAVVVQGFGPVSAMPNMTQVLTLDEIRDVVEYLTTVR